ncbi:histidine phosphatase superfamily [Tricladium varicosporioides]|nr:histidine phosphatase superfamily [Hymenoscyphus varicosporioides]
MSNPRVHIVRHAESEHNITKDFTVRDPGLTPLGRQQSTKLSETFPHSNSIGLILTSPLRRTVETTLLAFPHILDKKYYPPSSGLGVEGGAELLLEPDLQERSALPCDTGSNADITEALFPGLNFRQLGVRWLEKTGTFGADDEAVKDRAERVVERLQERVRTLNGEKRDIVVLTHGVFMKFLVKDEGIDLPKAGWKSFVIEAEGQPAVLVPI